MKKLLVSMFALGSFTAPVMAADLYPPVEPIPFSWNGFYLGGHAGYGWSDKKWTLIDSGNPNTGPEDCSGCGEVKTSYGMDGFLGGFQLGYNYQINTIVIGGEVDFSFSGMDGTGSWQAGEGEGDPGPDEPEFTTDRNASTELNWLMTVGPKLGMAMDQTLFYAEGGLAVADEDYSHLGNRDRIYKGSETRTGWFIGAGLEHAFDSNWSAKVEYNYIDFGSDDVSLRRTTGSGETRTAIFDVDQDMHVVKFGLNYRF